jgi:AcrR family transcriptional regulator
VHRRAALVDAAIELLLKNNPQEISFKQIAQLAEVPEGSAYHFYANKYDLFADVAGEMSRLFWERQSQPITRKVETWHDIMDALVERGALIYEENPVARELLIGPKTPPEVKQVDRENDQKIARVMIDRFDDKFELPEIDDFHKIMFWVIELTDLMFGLSVREHGCIHPRYIEEAKRISRGYLSTYLPSVLTKRQQR